MATHARRQSDCDVAVAVHCVGAAAARHAAAAGSQVVGAAAVVEEPDAGPAAGPYADGLLAAVETPGQMRCPAQMTLMAEVELFVPR